MQTKKASILLILGIVLTLVTPLSIAKTDNLAVWENIANGTLTSTWNENVDGEWTGQNDSGNWVYNCTTDDWAWTYNDSTPGKRWLQTYEVTSSDVEEGVASIMVDTGDASSFYGVLYYIDSTGVDPLGTGPAAYIFYNDAGTINYWNGSGYDTNISNASDLSKEYEEDFTGGFFRVKTLWNWQTDDTVGNCTVRFKVWDPASDEPIVWMVDERFTYYPTADNTSWYPGLFVESVVAGATETDFRRIFFWNLSYDNSGGGGGNTLVVNCPTMTADDLFNTYANITDTDDLYNQTQLMKTFINLWEMSALYSDNFYDAGVAENQNDTIYPFCIMVTEFRSFVSHFFDPVPPDAPDNILYWRCYVPTDGSSNESDYMLLRIDTDCDGVYSATDMAFWGNDTETIVYQGWNEVANQFFYGDIWSDPEKSGMFGEVFRDYSSGYYLWECMINWDMIYNGTSGERVGYDTCQMSIGWYDNDSDYFLNYQDFDPTDDDTPYPATDGRNVSLDPTWEGYNTSTYWALFTIDTSISGVPLADPVDPAAPTTAIENIMDAIWMIIYTIFVLALIGFVMGVLSKIMRK